MGLLNWFSGEKPVVPEVVATREAAVALPEIKEDDFVDNSEPQLSS